MRGWPINLDVVSDKAKPTSTRKKKRKKMPKGKPQGWPIYVQRRRIKKRVFTRACPVLVATVRSVARKPRAQGQPCKPV